MIAAGNDGTDCLPDASGSLFRSCSMTAALPWVSGNSDLLTQDGGWIVVGSVDLNNQISSFSNRAGVTKDHYLVAPGESIRTAGLNGGQNYYTGTSFAAPIVAGAMALMIQKWPNLKGKDVAQILFDTAQDLGAVGVDDIYGHGLIDLYAAFSPIGALGIPSSTSGGMVSANKVSITLSLIHI